ncbi:ABC transporter permease [Gluconacetobacter sacchari]|uniref:ABC transporter permease n=2 Tax=Gluconacetobacter sacchari TaxID=92759 RepID=A0A7W4IB77_9PROT|nr:ABC transporter permease [Gluconacetobacter sacchari]MBB2159648.1 ABC transporter permease [Gluconacetobacter sacchari]GBQ20711.1 spermidine/putrescine ABC transporter permease [Gluconacetobacter sacchari DSM 12717]
MNDHATTPPRWLQAALLAPGLAALLITFVLPVAWLARVSLLPQAVSLLPQAGPSVPATGLSAGAYARVLGDPFYWWIIGRTLGIGVVTACLAVPMAFPIALFLARSTSAWRGVLVVLAIAPLMTSTVIRTYGWMVILGRHGIINSLLLQTGLLAMPIRLDNGLFATVVALVEILMPYAVISILSTLGRVNVELEQAAALLGARLPQIVLRIILPLALPGLLTAALLVFVLAISSLVTPQLMGGGRVFVLATEIFNATTVTLDWPFAGALSVVLLILFGLVISLYQRVLARMEAQA